MASKGKGKRNPLLTLQTMAPAELFIEIDGVEYGLLRKDDLDLIAQARITRLMTDLQKLTSVDLEADRGEIAADLMGQMESGSMSEEDLAERISGLIRAFVRLVVPKIPGTVLDGLSQQNMQRIIDVFMQATAETN